jgi:hypothetical protein
VPEDILVREGEPEPSAPRQDPLPTFGPPAQSIALAPPVDGATPSAAPADAAAPADPAPVEAAPAKPASDAAASVASGG